MLTDSLTDVFENVSILGSMNDVVIIQDQYSDLQWEFTFLDPLLIQVKMPFFDEVRGLKRIITGIRIGLKQQSGLRENFGRDGGIEEPYYWGPSMWM